MGLRLALSFLVVSFVASSLATAGEPPTEPMLRIETGMHTAPIRGIAVDARNRYVVTGSDDKTVRLWEVATGRLLKVFRPPLADGSEGQIYPVAISPDGKTVAAGGMTGQDWDGAASLYLFDSDSGRLRQRLTGFPAAFFHLSYSKDGRFLVAALMADGMRVYRTEDSRLVGEDREYVSPSGGADFDATGRLVTTSYDGYIRLYDRSFRLIAKAQAPGGKQPLGISFSQDGTLIAIGFDDSPAVNVLSGADLSFQFAPNTNGVNGSLGKVAWSADGTRLYAGGRFLGRGQDGAVKLFIRMWSGSGHGAVHDLPTANKDLITRLVTLRNGGLAYGAAYPAWGVIDRAGHEVLFIGPATADYRDNQNGLLMSEDGTVVQFGFVQFGGSPARFALPARALELEPPPDRSLRSPRTSAPDMVVTDWENTSSPKLNGRMLRLDPYESSYSLAIAPNGTAAVLGAQWTLRCFTPTGQERWQLIAPGSVWALNITGDSKVLLAAFGDGTIRWYRLRDGKELLAFFPHADRKRWVLWTPSGYFVASPGGEELIGWHVNRGKEQAADFFPVHQFRHTYYRPDVIAKALETLEESEAVRLADANAGRKAQDTALTQRLPPVVTILSPSDGAEVSASDVAVRFVVRSPSGEPVTGIKALVDGRPVAGARDIAVRLKTGNAESDPQELRVSIQPKDTEIAVLAENRYTTSAPARVRVRWRGSSPALSKEAFAVKPKLYVLAVGVSQYQQKDLTLGFAAKDARDFVSVLQAQNGGLYREVVSKVLADAQATRDDIMDGLDWIQKETTSKDVAMVFVAGHGVNDPNGIYYFLPVNADPDRLKRTGVAFSDLKNTLASISGKTLFFVDTCHSGNVMGTRRGGADINAVVNELSSAENGAVVFAASTGKQYSLEDRAWGNGAFTKALVEGLGGKADYAGKGTISINMLDLYLSERVKELTKGQQTPTTTKPNTVPDFPVALKR